MNQEEYKYAFFDEEGFSEEITEQIINGLTEEEITSIEFIEELICQLDTEGMAVTFNKVLKRVEGRAKALRVLTDFRNTYKSVKKDIKAELKRQSQTSMTIQENNKGMFGTENDKQSFNVGAWTLDNDGVRRSNGKSISLACRYPIIITKRYINRENGKEEVEISWIKESKRRQLKVSRSVIASNTKLVNLAERGLPVDSGTASSLVSYLADFERYNVIATQYSTSKFGWIDGDFIPFSNGNIAFNAPDNYRQLAESVKVSGKYSEWLQTVRAIRATGRPEPLIYMGASFASVLVPIANISPFIVNLYGATGKGKTVNLRLASSIWALPKDFIVQSNSTLNSLEQRLNVLNNLPIMIDDLSKIRNRGEDNKFSDFIYMLCSGQGKGRLNKNIEMRETATWANTILTNIERPLTDDSMQGGAINRVLDFEIQEGFIFGSTQNVHEILSVIESNYGHGGKQFIEVVQENRQLISGLVSDYEEKIRECARDNGREKEEKQITPLAVILTADELAEKYIFKDGVRLDLNYCVGCLKNVDAVSEMERARQAIEDEIIINKPHYVPQYDGQGGKNYGNNSIYGYFDEQANTIAFIPAAFKDFAKKKGFSDKQYLSWAQKTGILIHDTGRNDKKIKIPSEERTRTRCYVFKRSIEPEGDQVTPKDCGFD